MKVGHRHQVEAGQFLPLVGQPPSLTQPVDRNSAPPWLRFLAAQQKFIAAAVDGNTRPNPLCANAADKIKASNDNANIVVLLLALGPVRFYDGADLLWDQEKQLVCPVNLVGAVDVFQVTHHGFDVSNNPLLVRSLNPTVAVMVNSPTKGCSSDTFALLTHTPSIQALYQLHKNLRADGNVNNTMDECIANLAQEDCAADYIKCSVEPDGRSYTLSIPARGHQRSFRSR
jgi:competence protein ComEC